MQNDVKFLRLDDSFEESKWIKSDEIVIESFDHAGVLYPLIPGKQYRVDLYIEHLDIEPPEIISKTKGKAEKVGESYAYYLYGYVKNSIFHVGNLQFDIAYLNYNSYLENKYIKLHADRIVATFLNESLKKNTQTQEST